MLLISVVFYKILFFCQYFCWTNRAGFNTSRMTSHGDLSWHTFFSTLHLLTCQPPSPESMHMTMI